MIRLFRFLGGFKLPVLLVLVFTFGQTLAELFLPTLMADIVDVGIMDGNVGHIWKVGLFMLLVAAGGTLASIVASYLSSKVSAGFGQTVRREVFDHVSRFSLQEFDTIGTASLINRTTNDINQVQQVLNMMMRMMVMAPMMCIGGIVMAISVDAQLSWTIVAVIPVLTAAIALIAYKGIPYFKVMQVKLDKLNLVLREQLTGVRVIRAFDRTAHEGRRYEQANADLTNTAIKVNKIMATMMPVMMLIMNLAAIAIIWFGGIRIDNGDMQIGSLMAFIQYAMQIMFSLIMLSFMFVMIPRAQVSSVRINEVLDMKPSIADMHANSAKDASSTDAGSDDSTGRGSSAISEQRGVVVFDRVTFSYPGAEMPALADISFRAAPGEVTAIIGGTGAGKSTLVNLLPRFYDVDSGSIRIGGVDIRELPQHRLRAMIGLVPQKAVLFSGTVADNIRYGLEDATDEQVALASRTAQAAEFIGGLEGQYAAHVEQGGSNLSGGQKQRLSIARALVRRPDIYVFDDSFSALDYKTDASLRAALRRETTEATLLIVAQRVSTVMDADRIIVLDEGKVAGIGTHRELMETNTIYREIVASQLSEEESA